ncbi:beta-glucanase [Lactobacillus crispatus]|nr:beta-glucanase [Lactobacillus crispatus]
MKKRWMLLGFLLVTIAFTGIMIYIRADNNSAVRNFFYILGIKIM